MKLKTPQAPLGTLVGDYLKLLVKANPCVDAVSLMSYAMPPSLQERLGESSPTWTLVDRALSLREESSMPFWDAAMLRCFDGSVRADDLLNAALYHQAAQRKRWLVNRDSFYESDTHQVDPSRRGLAFCSELVINGESAFMPLLDFHCPENNKNDELVNSVCSALVECEVAVFRSGKSYHAYVLSVDSQSKLREHLYRALFFAPIIDRQYVAHQLIEGCCALRISPTEIKPVIPTFKFLACRSTIGFNSQLQEREPTLE